MIFRHSRLKRIYIALAALLLSPMVCFAEEGKEPVTLEELLKQAAESHPKLKSARTAVYASGADVDAARAGWRPEVSAGSHLSVSQNRFGSTTTDERDLGAAFLNVDQLLWDFGATRAAMDAADHQLAASKELEAQTRRDIELQVAESYVELLLATQLKELRGRTLVDRTALRDKVKALVDGGVRPRSDLTRAQIDLENSKLDHETANSILKVRSQELSNAMGIKMPVEDPLADMLKSLPEPKSAADLQKLATGRRSDIIISRLAVSLSEEQLKAAKKEFYPVITASAGVSIGARDSDVDSGVEEGAYSLNDDYEEWSVSVQAGWSGLNISEQKASVRKAKAETAAALFEVEDVIRSVNTEIAVAVETLNEALKRVEASKAVRAAALRNHELIRKRYAAGASTILDVTDGQVTLTSAEAAILRAKADAWISYLRLMRSAAAPLID